MAEVETIVTLITIAAPTLVANAGGELSASVALMPSPLVGLQVSPRIVVVFAPVVLLIIRARDTFCDRLVVLGHFGIGTASQCGFFGRFGSVAVDLY